MIRLFCCCFFKSKKRRFIEYNRVEQLPTLLFRNLEFIAKLLIESSPLGNMVEFNPKNVCLVGLTLVNLN